MHLKKSQNEFSSKKDVIFKVRSLTFFRGGNHAVWLDNELCRGRSGPSLTFGNEKLTETEDFLCTTVEVFGFVPEI